MAGQTKFETFPYLLIITRYGGSEVLLPSSPASLPSLDVPGGERPAEQLVIGIQKKYHLETYCLWVSRGVTSGDSVPANYAVLEVLEQNQPAPTGMLWASAREVPFRADGAAGATIRSFIEDLNRYSADPKSAPFAKPAWIQELFIWAREQLAPLGLRVTGGFWQLNAGPTFSLIRLQTNRAPVWFKATGEPNAHELTVSLALAQLIPEHVPRILGVHSSWNGWLSSHVRGKLLCDVGDRSAWESVARALAQLQIRSLEKGPELREAQVRDLGTGDLVELIDPFIDCMSQLMRAQQKQSPAPLTTVELASLRDQLAEAFRRLENLGIPPSIGRLDLNPGNIIVSREGVVFLDWAETYWGHPFFSIAYLVEHFRRHSPDVASESKLRSSYAEPWRAVCATQSVSEALAIAPLVAVFAYTVAGRNWRYRETHQDPRVASFLRSMTRRMHRETRLLEETRQTCLS
jgi:phosphotransferase family enzyme